MVTYVNVEKYIHEGGRRVHPPYIYREDVVLSDYFLYFTRNLTSQQKVAHFVSSTLYSVPVTDE